MGIRIMDVCSGIHSCRPVPPAGSRGHPFHASFHVWNRALLPRVVGERNHQSQGDRNVRPSLQRPAPRSTAAPGGRDPLQPAERTPILECDVGLGGRCCRPGTGADLRIHTDSSLGYVEHRSPADPAGSLDHHRNDATHSTAAGTSFEARTGHHGTGRRAITGNKRWQTPTLRPVCRSVAHAPSIIGRMPDQSARGSRSPNGWFRLPSR